MQINISPLVIKEKYEDRQVEFCGIWEDNSWKFKIYKITHKNNSPADEKIENTAKAFALKCVTTFTDIAALYGLGYIILHKGMDSNFIVINFWAGENMIRTHAFISTLENPYDYRDITETGMNVCVWDALIHNFERNSWVENILKNPDEPEIDKYMNSKFTD